MKSMTFKAGFVFILFTIFNLAFFTFSMYVEQNDVLVKNREIDDALRTKEVYLPLKYLFLDDATKNGQTLTKSAMLEKITAILSDIDIKDYLILSEKGDVVYPSAANLVLEDRIKKDARSAVAAREFLNQPYRVKAYDADNTYSYIPVNQKNTENLVIVCRFTTKSVEANSLRLYRVVLTVIVIVLAAHLVFGISLYFMVLGPVKRLNKKALEMREGALSSPIAIKRKDEVGQLGLLAAVIEKQAIGLAGKNRIAEHDIDAASQMPPGMHPAPGTPGFFNNAIYQRHLEKASGDYHDIFKINKQKYGFLLADVSGPDGSTALTTMRVQSTFRRLVSRQEDAGKLFESVAAELGDFLRGTSRLYAAFYFTLDANGEMTYASAGKSTAFLIKPRPQKMFTLTAEGGTTGLTSDAAGKYKAKTIVLEPGDKIILVSDGIVDAKNDKGEPYAAKRLLQSIARRLALNCEDLKKAVLEDLEGFLRNVKRNHDETLMIVEVKQATSGKIRSNN